MTERDPKSRARVTPELKASRRRRAVTLADVARRAAVSPSTVSNVVRASDAVAPKTRARVEKVIAELGYAPDVIARSLRRRGTTTLGLVVPDLTNPFFGLLVRAAERAAHAKGYALFTVHTECEVEMEREGVQALIGRRVDGVLIGGIRAGSGQYEELLRRGIPVVLAGFDLDDPRVGVVAVDDVEAMTTILDHLQALGHRRVAFVSDEPAQAMGRRRGNTLGTVAMRRGVEVFDGRAGATALVFQNDEVAIDYMNRLEREGVRIPGDISLVGFDDIPLAAHARIELTTVRNDASEIGRRSAEILVAAAREDTPPTRELLPAELIVRSTTGPAPAANGLVEGARA